MAQWNVEGTDEFWSWYDELTARQTHVLNRVVDLLEQFGPLLPRPHCGTLTGSTLPNLKELRADGEERGHPYHLRVLFCFDPRRSAILLLGGDKTGDFEGWYRRSVPEAERLYADYLEELRQEGLLP